MSPVYMGFFFFFLRYVPIMQYGYAFIVSLLMYFYKFYTCLDTSEIYLQWFTWPVVLWLQNSVLFSVPWSVGAVTDPDGRVKFDEFYRNLLLGKMEGNEIPKSVGKVEVPFPENGYVYDYCYEVRKLVISAKEIMFLVDLVVHVSFSLFVC